MFTGIEVVVGRYCFHELISMALANEPTLVWQSTCDGSMLGNGTGLLHSSGANGTGLAESYPGFGI